MIIKIDVCNAFNSSDRAFSLDCINGRASCDYACDLKRDDAIGTIDSLTNLFGYFKAIRLSLTSGLGSNPANREIASSSGASEHQDIFFPDFFSIFF